LYGGCDTETADSRGFSEGRTVDDRTDPLADSWVDLHRPADGDAERASRLSQISTLWTKLLQAHGGARDAAAATRHRLLQRYGGAVHRYLLGAVRDPDAAADLAQEFALRFVRGDFAGADPQRGRFRDYLKRALSNLVNDFHRSRRHQPQGLTADHPAPAAGGDDRDFLDSCREDVIDRTWQALAGANATYHDVLRLRIGHPDLTSEQLAALASEGMAQVVTAAWVRKNLQRAQAKFADLLLDLVTASLDRYTPEALVGELRELDLLKYCRAALERRGLGGAAGGTPG
jgi:RNA polymerase sigma-70 factor (ECF subfamily)